MKKSTRNQLIKFATVAAIGATCLTACVELLSCWLRGASGAAMTNTIETIVTFVFAVAIAVGLTLLCASWLWVHDGDRD